MRLRAVGSRIRGYGIETLTLETKRTVTSSVNGQGRHDRWFDGRHQYPRQYPDGHGERASERIVVRSHSRQTLSSSLNNLRID